MADKLKTEAREVVNAEKGDSLTPRNLHLRLRVAEVVLLLSLLLNVLHWYVAGVKDDRLQNQVNNISTDTGVQR